MKQIDLTKGKTLKVLTTLSVPIMEVHCYNLHIIWLICFGLADLEVML